MVLCKPRKSIYFGLVLIWSLAYGFGAASASSTREGNPGEHPRPAPENIAATTPPPPSTSQDGTAETNRKLVEYTGELARFTRWLVYATLCLAVIAATQVGSTLYVAVSQLRAYVVVATGDLINVAAPPPPLAGQPPSPPTKAAMTNPNLGPIAILTTKNTGQTVAHDVAVWANIAVREWPLASGLPAKLPGMNIATIVLGPGIASNQTRPLPHPLTPQEISDLRAGTAAIYVWGEITYRDIFHRRRFVRFRTFHHSSIGVLGESSQLNFADIGNEAN